MGKVLYRCQPLASKVHPEWAHRAVIYELNIRQFSDSGDFAGVEAQLPRLRELGVDLLWLMPIFPIGEVRRKGTLGSYYAVRDYCAVNPEFGTLDQLRALVDRAHELGLRVILDWVPNHTSRDAAWVSEHPNWYRWDEARGEIATPYDWTDTAQLDYDNPQMRQGMVEAMRFWLTETAIDGFRVDMAMLEPLEFWELAIPELQRTRPDLFLLAEAEGPEFHRVAFDASYAWELHHLLVDVAQGRIAAPAQAVRGKLCELSERYPPDGFLMHFTSNHDENSWKGSEFQRFGPFLRAATALTYILPGIPLIYNGQEAGSPKSLAFFDKDPVDWSGLRSDEHGEGEWVRFYQSLNELRHTYAPLWSGSRGGDVCAIDNSLSDRVLSIKRKLGERVVIGLFNLSGDHADLEFPDPDFTGLYHELGTETPAHLESGRHFWLPPWGYFIYYK